MPSPPRSNFPVGPAQQPVRPALFSMPRAQIPMVVSTVGGVGIAVACASLLACLVYAGIAVGLIGVSATSAQKVKQFAPASLPVSKPDQPAVLAIEMAALEPGLHGTGADDRMVVLTLFRRLIELSPAQEQQLDALLRENGGRVFPHGVPRNDAMLEMELIDRGTMPAASSSDTPPVFFITAGGRVIVNDRGAVFYPADRSPTVRSSAERRLNSTGHAILRQEDIHALIDLIRQTSGEKLNASQTAALNDMLRNPDQTLIAINGPSDAPSIGINGASAQPGGYILVGFTGGAVLLSPAGVPIFKNDPLPGVSVAACASVIGMALADIALAVWLIVISSRLMKQKLVTTGAHRRWAGLKIVSAILGAVAFGAMIQTHIASRPVGSNNAQLMGMVAGIAAMIVGCAFPIATLVLLATRRARLYFDGVM